MEFIQILSGDVKQGKTRDLQEWLGANEAKLAETAPDGAEYIGTYFAMYSSEKDMGSAFSLMRMENYGTQDKLAAEVGTPFGDLLNELVDFFDQGPDANWGSILLKRVTDASIYGSDA